MKHTMLLAVVAVCVPAVFGHAAEVPMQPFSMDWRDNTGGLVDLIEPVQGLITLVNLQSAASARFTPLDNAAKPIGPAISAVEATEGLQMAIGQTPTTWYLIEVER